jgi:hypothetical protein
MNFVGKKLRKPGERGEERERVQSNENGQKKEKKRDIEKNILARELQYNSA